MRSKLAAEDYQLLAAQYKVGDSVQPFASTTDQPGRVLAVWPAIGMLDVAFPTGVRRFPVEDMCKTDADTEYLQYMTVPAGTSSITVAGGPFPSISEGFQKSQGPEDTLIFKRIVLGYILKRD